MRVIIYRVRIFAQFESQNPKSETIPYYEISNAQKYRRGFEHKAGLITIEQLVSS
jgi:hypothetical protein